ncbi:MAG: hypothetical protein ACM3VS_12365 [Candidatus Dadabacteria bacterium]
MFLYSTILVIKNQPVPYTVTREREPELLLFKPELPVEKDIYSPIFWARKIDGRWAPLNIQDQSLINEVVMNIEKHGIK